MSRRFSSAAAIMAAAAVLTAGCADTDRPSVVPVRGQVTYQGKPVAGATIAFLCPGAPRLAIGTTDEAGNYQLTTFQPNDGAMVGTHVVTISKTATQSEATLPAADTTDSGAMSKAIEEAVEQSVQQMKKSDSVKAELPEKYAERHTSDLREKVNEDENIINFDLTD